MDNDPPGRRRQWNVELEVHDYNISDREKSRQHDNGGVPCVAASITTPDTTRCLVEQHVSKLTQFFQTLATIFKLIRMVTRVRESLGNTDHPPSQDYPN